MWLRTVRLDQTWCISVMMGIMIRWIARMDKKKHSLLNCEYPLDPSCLNMCVSTVPTPRAVCPEASRGSYSAL